MLTLKAEVDALREELRQERNKRLQLEAELAEQRVSLQALAKDGRRLKSARRLVFT